MWMELNDTSKTLTVLPYSMRLGSSNQRYITVHTNRLMKYEHTKLLRSVGYPLKFSRVLSSLVRSSSVMSSIVRSSCVKFSLVMSSISKSSRVKSSVRSSSVTSFPAKTERGNVEPCDRKGLLSKSNNMF